MQRSAPSLITNTIHQLMCRQRQPRPMASRVHIHTHTLLTTTAQLQLVCGCDVTRVRLSQADPTSAGRRDIKRSQVFAAASWNRVTGIPVECQSADGMHQTFTLQTRRQTKPDGVRAEKAEQDACKRPNQDGQTCASPRARTHSTADEFSSGAPNSRAGCS